jgi:ribonuclease P protein component
MPSVADPALSVTARPALWRISDRSTFSALRRRGRRARTGPLTVTWLAPDQQAPAVPPRVGFAIGKAVGGAVVRNRIRRRLRAAFRELQRSDRLPAGAYLVGATVATAELPWSELVAALGEAVESATATTGATR